MKKAIFITGPTSSGKSDLTIWLAKKINGEIINADSRQVYKYLNWGSGKISKKEQKLVKHYLLSIASPKKNYSLGRWLNDVNKVIKKIYRKNKIPIFCGGTILYLRALKEGWILPKVKPDYKLRKKLEKFSLEELIEKIKKVNPDGLKKLDLKNKRRVIRRLEIILKTKKPPELIKNPQYDLLILAPYLEEKKLFKKIKKRLIQRVPKIIKEIKKLRKMGISFKRIINWGLEYKWFGLFVKGEIDLKTALEKCYQDTLRFTKRQIRELKKIEGVNWVKNKIEAYQKVKAWLSTKN